VAVVDAIVPPGVEWRVCVRGAVNGEDEALAVSTSNLDLSCFRAHAKCQMVPAKPPTMREPSHLTSTCDRRHGSKFNCDAQ